MLVLVLAYDGGGDGPRAADNEGSWGGGRY
jgi:hypothetical protein